MSSRPSTSLVAVIVLLAASVVSADDADSPTTAAKKFLAAWKAKGTNVWASMIRHDQKKLNPLAKHYVLCSDLTHYAVGTATVSGDEAIVHFTWRATLDGAELLAAARKAAEAEGASEKEIHRNTELMGRAMPDVKRHFEKQEHTMVLQRFDGQWFVTAPLAPPRSKKRKSIQVEMGRFLLLRSRKGKDVVALKITTRTETGDGGAKYEWHHQPGGSGDFTAPGVRNGEGEVFERYERTPNPKGGFTVHDKGSQLRIEAGPFALEWSHSDWVYFGPEIEAAATQWAKLGDVNAADSTLHWVTVSTPK